MFDCHLHSRISFDGTASGMEMALAAQKAGLREICFTDHLDYDPLEQMGDLTFDTAQYNEEYDSLEIPGLAICRGMEFGMLEGNVHQFQQDLKRRKFDFVLGSVHFVDGLDVYLESFWENKTVWEAERRFLETTLACVGAHEAFDVLAHLTCLGKIRVHRESRAIPFTDHRELIDEILRVLAKKGKGLEINTSGVDCCGDSLPGAAYLRRFKELGGEIVTVGSDAHTADRVGQYAHRACALAKEIFGYVCTFRDRKPVFHKL